MSTDPLPDTRSSKIENESEEDPLRFALIALLNSTVVPTALHTPILLADPPANEPFKIDTQCRPFRPGTREPEDDSCLVRKHDANALMRRPALVDWINVGEVVA